MTECRHTPATTQLLSRLNWGDAGLLPAVVQDANSGAVLMLGYMNREALAATLQYGRVTFWSRSRQRLWTKGETSGHVLELCAVEADCDADAILVLAKPAGPVCHTGTPTCWGAHAPQAASERLAFLGMLEDVIGERMAAPAESSYTSRLVGQGLRRIAQKVGEEGLELALAAVAQTDAEILGEAADLLYHTLVLLKAKGLSLAAVVATLQSRHDERQRKPPPGPTGTQF